METAGILLIVLGAVSLVAALAGGLKFSEVEIPALSSRVLRVILALVGAFFFLTGLGLVSLPGGTPPVTQPTTAPVPPPDQASPPVQASPTVAGPTPDQVPTPAAPPAEPDPDPFDQYGRDADSACGDVAAVTPTDVSGMTVDETWLEVFEIGRAWQDLSATLNGMETPPGVSVHHAALVLQAQWFSEAVANAENAYHAGDLAGAEAQWNDMESALAQFNGIATGLGLESCMEISTLD